MEDVRTATTRLGAGARTDEPRSGEAPQRIGRYRVLGVLGHGGMSIVYAAFDDQLRRRVAIKELDRQGEDERERWRARREAQAMARLTHPNIVAVYEVFEVDARLYIVMEHVVGRTLRDWLRERHRSRAEVLPMLLQAGRGIAAAHAADLVHRDLKPDNIMVGDDGRVRVMDFGIARVMEPLETEPWDATGPSRALGDESRAESSTRTGAFLGTPGYASPEQALGLAADARSDVYGYCVVAFEALHGERPGVGGSPSRRARAAEHAGRGVPTWLDAVIGRGLAVEPEHRWASMDALLEALAHDPTAIRRRRRLWLALGVLMVALAIVLADAISRWREERARALVEAAALARLHAVEQSIVEAEAAGDVATADAAFRAFVSDPEHRGTRALARAWLGQGDRHVHDHDVAAAAYAEAYVSAKAPEDERASLHGLGTVFFEQWDAAPLERSVALSRARGGDDSDLQEHALQAALWHRDLDAALAELDRPGSPRAAWRPLLASLSRARTLPLSAERITVLPAGGPVRMIVRGHEPGELVLLDDALDEVGRTSLEGPTWLVEGQPWAVAEVGDRAVVLDLLDGTTLGTSWSSVHYVAPYDATRDGVPELFLGRKWPHFGLWRWDLRPEGLLESKADPNTDVESTSLETHVVGDLDGDGLDELVLALAEWQHFGFAVFRPNPFGELEWVAEHRLGRVGGMAIVHREGRSLLAVFNDRFVEAPEVFPEPPHTGEPPGVRLFALEGAALREVEAEPLARSEALGRFQAQQGAVAGDLDGDGLEDLAFSLIREASPCWMLVLRQTEAGFDMLPIAGLVLLGGAQLDDDAETELLVQRCPGEGLTVLGLGDERLVPLDRPSLESVALPPALSDRALAERWQRARDLADLGLPHAAAASLREASLMTGDRAARSALIDRAAELLVRDEQALELLELEHDVHDDPQVLARALERRAWALSRLGRYDEALEVARALERSAMRAEGEDAEAHARVEALSAMLDPTARLEADFRFPLAAQWQVLVPGAVRRDPAVGSLDLEVPATGEVVAQLPIEWDGRPLALELDLLVERLEFGACVSIELVDGDDEPWLGTSLCGMAGAEQLYHDTFVIAGPKSRVQRVLRRDTNSAIDRHALAVQLAYFPQERRFELVLDRGDQEAVELLAGSVTVAPAPGRHRLVIRSEPAPEPNLGLVRLRHVRLRGARVAALSAEDQALARPAWLLAEREPRAALQALDALPSPPALAPALRMLALAELGDVEGLARVAPSVLAHASDERWMSSFVLALRRHPVAGAVLREAGGASLSPVLATVFALAVTHRSDAALRGELLDALQGIEHLPAEGEHERAALRLLLESRADLWLRSGDRSRADRDLQAAEPKNSTSRSPPPPEPG